MAALARADKKGKGKRVGTRKGDKRGREAELLLGKEKHTHACNRKQQKG